jgi:two-component system NtrC family response regulator
MESNTIRGSHPVMRSILSAAERIAGTDVCVLIVGEKGTGKDLLARYIHAASPRADGPFVRVDCQELGAVRSGTTMSGALAQDVAGGGMAHALSERARGGTLFLDQISALGNELQARLLSALHGESGVASDVRMLASRDPADALPSCLAAAGLALVEIPVPPLRQRRSDIPLLVEHFLELYVTRHGVPPRRIDTEAMVQLWQYDWPGNVRELENLVERVVVLNRGGVIRAADLPRHVCTVSGKGGGTAANGNGYGVASAGLR